MMRENREKPRRRKIKDLSVAATELSAAETKPNGFSLSAEFWTDFVAHYWEKRPLVLKQPFGAPLTTAAHLFDGLVRASDRYRAGERNFEPRFHIDNALLRADIGKHTPESSDGSIAGYAERMNRTINRRRFGLVLNDYCVHDAILWRKMCTFLRGLYQRIGIPAEAAEASVFLGNYKKTPFGLHKDSCSMFMFVIEGRKRIRAWPDEYFSGRKDVSNILDYERFLDHAVTLDGAVGDMIYWPSSYWHVGESVGGLSVCVNVVVCVNFQPSSEVLNHAAKMVHDRLGNSDQAEAYPFDPDRLQASAGRLPRAIERAIRAVRDVSCDPSLANTVKLSWLNRVTGFGFRSVPPPLPHRTLEDDAVVSADSEYPIVWLRVEDDEIVCSANGHSFSIAAHPNIAKLLERLNRGEPCSVKNLADQYAGTAKVAEIEFEAAREDIRALLEKLYTLRAITISSAQPRR